MSTISSGTTLTTALVQTGDTTGNLVIKTNNGNTTAITINTVGAIGTGSSPDYGTSGYALISGGSGNAVSWQAVQAFTSGTVMLFRQTSAPTGWTKDTTNFNDSALRVVTGSVSSGGTQGFTTAFASQAVNGSIANTTAGGSVSITGGSVGSFTLTTTEIPNHSHNSRNRAANFGGSDFFVLGNGDGGGPGTSTNTTGGGGSHSHSFSAPSGSFTGTAHNHTFTGTAINMAVKYCDVIFATKD